MTHAQFLDEPGDVIAWMLYIDREVRAVERQQQLDDMRAMTGG